MGCTAGRGTEIDARVQREAASDTTMPSMRADRWTEIAERREIRGDRGGAVRALLEACKLDPEPLERWSALERVAELAGDDDARVAALEKIVERVVGDDGKIAPSSRRGSRGPTSVAGISRLRVGLGRTRWLSIRRTKRP